MACKIPEHRRSLTTGRCLDCGIIRQRRYRETIEAGKPGRKQIAKIIQGNPCRVCGSTDRYASSGICAPCSRARGKGQRINKQTYDSQLIPMLMTWLLSPRITDANTNTT